MSLAGQLPRPRGPLTEALLERLGGSGPAAIVTEPEGEEDLHLALWCLYELHYRGFVGVDERLEWAPDLIALRLRLEERFEDDLCALVGDPAPVETSVQEALTELVTVEEQQRPRLATYLGSEATVEQFTEFLMVRSAYHLKESDPHAFVVPRLGPAPKAALAELQYDEFGDGRPDRVHQQLYADGLAAMDLDASYGAYVDRTPGIVLAETNAMSLFALNRRLRGAAVGHLAAFESTSSVPCRLIALGARRLGLPEAVAAYYDEHVEADAIHEQVAIRDICGRLVADEPALADDVLFGARASLGLSDRAGGALLTAWREGRSPLLPDPMGAAA